MDSNDTVIFKTIFEQSPISTQIFSPDGTTILVNKAWEKLWRVDKKELLFKYNILQDKQLENKGVMSYIKQAFAGQMVNIPAVKYETEQTIPKIKAVKFRWVKAVIYPIKNKTGQITQVVIQHEDITEQQMAEEKIKESESKFRKLFDSNIIGVFISNFDGTFLNANEVLLSMIGYTRQELIQGKVHRDKLTPPEYGDRSRQAVMDLKTKGTSNVYEKEYIHKNGTRIPVLIAVARIDDTDTCIGFVLNMTERKRNEDAIYQLAAIVESSDDAILSKTLDGVITSWNKGAEKLYGYSVKEVVGKHISLTIPPQLIHEEKEIIKRLRQGVKIDHFETFRINKTGRQFPVSISISPIRNESGRIIGASNITRDISEQKQFQQDLFESEERLRLALEAGKIGVWDWDIENKSLTWTDNLYSIHGVNKKKFDLNLDNFLKLIHPEDRSMFDDAIQKAISGKSTFDTQFRIVTSQGVEKWVSTKAVVTYRGKKAIRMLGATLDISQQKQLEQDKNDFLSMASHELKTPLTSMKMFIDLLDRQLKKSDLETPIYYIKRIRDQADRLGELINDLLDVSRIETGKLRLNLEKFSLSDLVLDTVESIQPATKKHHILVKKKSDIKVLADKYRVYQVLVNLLTNAIKYSPNSDKVIVDLKPNHRSVVVSVKDFGVGINKNQQQRIFDKLYQVSEPAAKTFPGLGLGLYISKEIIERHKGMIWVESQKGKGSTFFFSLPLV